MFCATLPLHVSLFPSNWHVRRCPNFKPARIVSSLFALARLSSSSPHLPSKKSFTIISSNNDGDDEEGSNEEDEEFPWLKTIVGTEKGPDGKVIGHCVGKLVQQTFCTSVEEPTQDMSELAFSLFDRYRRLEDKWKTDTTNNGSFIWQEDVDTGDLLLIEHVSVVTEEWRNRSGPGPSILFLAKPKPNPRSSLRSRGWLDSIYKLT
jgi:hypothetical protein